MIAQLELEIQGSESFHKDTKSHEKCLENFVTKYLIQPQYGSQPCNVVMFFFKSDSDIFKLHIC